MTNKDTKIEITVENLTKVIFHVYDMIKETSGEGVVDPSLLLTLQKGLLEDYTRAENINDRVARSVAMFDLNMLVHSAEELDFGKDEDGE